MLFLCQYFMLFLWYFYVLCFYISPRHHVMVYFYGIPYSPYLYGVPHISIAFPQFLWYALYVYIPIFPSPPCETPCETGHGRQWGRHAGCPHHVDGRWRGDLSDERGLGRPRCDGDFFIGKIWENHHETMGRSGKVRFQSTGFEGTPFSDKLFNPPFVLPEIIWNRTVHGVFNTATDAYPAELHQCGRCVGWYVLMRVWSWPLALGLSKEALRTVASLVLKYLNWNMFVHSLVSSSIPMLLSEQS